VHYKTGSTVWVDGRSFLRRRSEVTKIPRRQGFTEGLSYTFYFFPKVGGTL